VKDRFLNYAMYQAGWFVMVLGAAKGYPWSGALAGFLLLVAHLVLVRETKAEIRTVLTIGALGTAVDSVQALAGVFVFESGYWTYWIVPLWLTVMWMQFATLFHFVLSWMKGRYWLSALLGAAGGPAAYYTGERLGAVIFPMGSIFSLAILAGVWAIMTPLCVFIAARYAPAAGMGVYRFVSHGRQGFQATKESGK